jgi:hypothetical protein
MHRSLGVLLAAAITVAALGGTSAASAATGPDGTTALAQAATEARQSASVALGGLALPTGSTAQLHAAASKSSVQSIHESIRAKAGTKRYDIRVDSVGPKTHPTRITLAVGAKSVKVAVRRLVHISVRRHGAKTVTLAATTTFRRFVVMSTDLLADPLKGKQKRFATRASLVATLAHGLAIGGGEVTREYGAVLRFAQMAVDLGATLLQAMEYTAEHPDAKDLSAVPTTHTTTGSGGYAGSVTISGTPTTFTASAVNTTDDSTLTETFDQHSLTMSYTVHGTTTTTTVTF